MSSSKLAVGIVGLPNVGKSTLFNALLKKQQAYVANFPFATIEPNIGIVPVPDNRLKTLSDVIFAEEKMTSLPPQVPATVEFIDIAGIISGAHKGEGLGNKFLSHIREVDAICHVVRVFTDSDIIKEGSVDPVSDFDVIQTELKLADLQTLEKQREPKGNASKEELKRWKIVTLLKNALEKGDDASSVNLDEEDLKIAKGLGLMTLKPKLVALNVSESDLENADELEAQYAAEFGIKENQVVSISAKLEAQLAELPVEEQVAYLNDLGLSTSGLERLIKKAFATLGLITFLTAGEKEVRAWTIKQMTRAQDAAGAIHNDFVKNFIKADVVALQDFVAFKGWKGSRENGKVRSEGKEYIMKDGDVVEFKVGV